MRFCDFMVYLGGPGINAGVGFVVSVVLEIWPGFDAVLPRQKRLAVMGLTFALPTLALMGQILACGVAFSWELVWNVVQAGFVAFFASQGTHTVFLPATDAAARAALRVAASRRALRVLNDRTA